MTHIPDAAVQAGAEAALNELREMAKGMSLPFDYVNSISVGNYRLMRAVLTAALPHLSAPCAVEVVKLDWVKGDVDENYHFANTSIQNYIITIFPEENLNIRLLGTSQHGAWYNNIEEAKAAAQADFERRVRECVVTKPVDVKETCKDSLQVQTDISNAEGKGMTEQIVFGWGAPIIKEQLPNLSDEVAEHFQKDSEALTRLRIRGYITDSQRKSIMNKFGKEISKAVSKSRAALAQGGE